MPLPFRLMPHPRNDTHVFLPTLLELGCVAVSCSKEGCDVFLFQINTIPTKITANTIPTKIRASDLVWSTFGQFQNILDEREKNKELRVLAK